MLTTNSNEQHLSDLKEFFRQWFKDDIENYGEHLKLTISELHDAPIKDFFGPLVQKAFVLRTNARFDNEELKIHQSDTDGGHRCFLYNSGEAVALLMITGDFLVVTNNYNKIFIIKN